jgi:hypothetical protein
MKFNKDGSGVMTTTRGRLVRIKRSVLGTFITVRFDGPDPRDLRLGYEPNHLIMRCDAATESYPTLLGRVVEFECLPGLTGDDVPLRFPRFVKFVESEEQS